MAERVYLHVGTMKSATSYVQTLCHRNRGQLLDAGVWWPGTRRNFEAVADCLRGKGRDASPDGAWSALVHEIREYDGDVLVSNELMIGRPLKNLDRLVTALKPLDIRVVITARDLARTVPSQWQTMVRSRGTVPWAEFVDCVCSDEPTRLSDRFWQRHDLSSAVSRWAQLVPFEKISLVTVPPSGSDPVIIGDRFMSVLGRDVGPLTYPSVRKASLGAHSAELLRRLNHDTKDWSWSRYREAFKVALNSRILEKRASVEPRFGLTAEQLQRIRTRAERMVSELEALNVSVVGQLSDLVPSPQAASATVDPGQSSPEELLAAASYGLVEMSRKYADLESQMDAIGRGRRRPDQQSPRL